MYIRNLRTYFFFNCLLLARHSKAIHYLPSALHRPIKLETIEGVEEGHFLLPRSNVAQFCFFTFIVSSAPRTDSNHIGECLGPPFSSNRLRHIAGENTASRCLETNYLFRFFDLKNLTNWMWLKDMLLSSHQNKSNGKTENKIHLCLKKAQEEKNWEERECKKAKARSLQTKNWRKK